MITGIEPIMIVQENHYDPWGLNFGTATETQKPSSLSNRWQYNSKEKLTDLGIGWNDYGARMYMSDIGRWNGIDQLSELDFEESPYNYVDNNPISRIDLFGMIDLDGDGKDDTPNLLDEVEVKAERLPQFRGFFENMSIAYERNEQKYGHPSPYREHFQAGGRDAAAIVSAPILAIGAAEIGVGAILQQGIAYVTRARMASIGRLLWKSATKTTLNPGAGLAEFGNQLWQRKPINYASVLSNTFLSNPFTSAFVGSYFDNTTKNDKSSALIVKETLYGGIGNIIGDKLSVPSKNSFVKENVGTFLGNFNSNLFGDAAKELYLKPYFEENEKK